jgi:hypothetical protein
MPQSTPTPPTPAVSDSARQQPPDRNLDLNLNLSLNLILNLDLDLGSSVGYCNLRTGPTCPARESAIYAGLMACLKLLADS